ncbi:MAG: hypothetical protein EBT66_10135 [Bacteroidetes bacterium]|nr:hypothetical protein [Bacteroidota bacterium]
MNVSVGYELNNFFMESITKGQKIHEICGVAMGLTGFDGMIVCSVSMWCVGGLHLNLNLQNHKRRI